MRLYENDYLRNKLTSAQPVCGFDAVGVRRSGAEYPIPHMGDNERNLFVFVPLVVTGSTVSTIVSVWDNVDRRMITVASCDVTVEYRDGMDNLERDVLAAADGLVSGGTLRGPDGLTMTLTADDVVRCCQCAHFGDYVTATYDFTMRVRGLRMLDDDLRA